MTRILSIALLALASFLPPAHAAGTVADVIDRLGLDLRPDAQGKLDGMAAIEAAAGPVVRQLIDADPESPELTRPNASGRTPLMRAAMNGYADIVEILLTNPPVRATINARDKLGASAWALSQMALPLSMAACEPDFLAPARAPLWRPYLTRSGYFWRQAAGRFTRIGNALRAAGATADEALARAAWQARCPATDLEFNTGSKAPETLLDAVTAHATERLHGLNELLTQPRTAEQVQLRPIEMRAPADPGTPWPRAYRPGQRADAPPRPPDHVPCERMEPPRIPAIPWRGEATFTARVEVQAGHVVLADIRQTDGTLAGRDLLAYQWSVQRALAGYECAGDHVFEQVFRFKVK